MIKRCFLALTLLGLNVSCSPAQQDLTLRGLVYCAEGSPESFNPQLVTSGTTIDAISQHLYDRLLDIDPRTGNLLPALASDWQISKDGLTYTFTIRNDVSFHHTDYFKPTRKLTAHDVVFTFNRILDIEHPFHLTATEYPYFDSVQWRELVHSVTENEQHQVVFQLNQPDSSFLSTLATDFAAILSAEYGQQLISQQRLFQLDSLPIGSGPFKFREYKKDVLIRYHQHENYWRNKGNLEQLVIDIVPDNTKRLAKLLAKECDVAPIPRILEHSPLTKRNDFEIDQQTSLNVGYWAFNSQKPPFNQVKVRQALAYAVNKPAILQAVYFGQAEEAHSLLPPNSWGYLADSRTARFDLAKAKELLVEAGYPNGFSIDIWAMPVQRLYNPNALRMAELLQADLAKIGVQANIVSYEWNTFRRKLRAGEHDSVLIGWTADNADPDNFLRPLLSCAAAISGSNRTNWCDPHYDKLIADAVLTADIAERKALYYQAQHYVADQVPLVPIAHSRRFQVKQNKITGLVINPYGGISFTAAGKKP